MKSAIFSITLFFGFFASAQTKLVCVSWLNYELEIKETDVSEYATAHIDYEKDNWGYSADVFEGSLNYLTIFYKPAKLAATSRSLSIPVAELSGAIEIDGVQASVDCDIRPPTSQQ